MGPRIAFLQMKLQFGIDPYLDRVLLQTDAQRLAGLRQEPQRSR